MRNIISAISLTLMLGSSMLPAQYFGKNKVQTKEFHWQYLQSEHFDIYFSKGGKNIAEFAARVAEESYQALSNDLRFDLLDRVKIIVYNSHNDFGQTNRQLLSYMQIL